jgi:hypothetical protein
MNSTAKYPSIKELGILSIGYIHRWASFSQKATVTSFPLLAKYKIETVASFLLPAPQKIEMDLLFSLPAQKNN